MRPDHGALVLGQVVAEGPLPREDIEVIEPEVGQYLQELALAVHRPEHLGPLELPDHRLGTLLARHLHALLAERLGERVGVHQAPRRHRRDPETRQPPLHGAVVQALGVELGLDPGSDTHPPDRLHVAGPGPYPRRSRRWRT